MTTTWGADLQANTWRLVTVLISSLLLSATDGSRLVVIDFRIAVRTWSQILHMLSSSPITQSSIVVCILQNTTGPGVRYKPGSKLCPFSEPERKLSAAPPPSRRPHEAV